MSQDRKQSSTFVVGRICEACGKTNVGHGYITAFAGYWLHVKCAKKFLATHPVPKPART